MDVAYNQHAARRKNRSTANLHHLTLAPLTTKLPLRDHADVYPGGSNNTAVTTTPVHNTSYLQGKSAPTTPRLLSRSPPRSTSHTRVASLTKSKSTTHLAMSSSTAATSVMRHSATSTISTSARRRREEPGLLPGNDGSDSDWLLRTGALISTETRESKGQAWLVSRASSTSLAGMRDAAEEALERELARERELASRHASRRGSLGPGQEDEAVSSATGSRFGSRPHSRAGGTRSALLTPAERVGSGAVDGYFPYQAGTEEEYVAGPDFVNLDEKLEAIEQDTTQEDEATVRRLVRREKDGSRSWMGSILGWSLFSVDEHDEDESAGGSEGGDEEEEEDEDEEEAEDEDEEATEGGVAAEGSLRGERRKSGARQFEGVTNLPEECMPQPRSDDGGWQDAAWLLSVASKVLL